MFSNSTQASDISPHSSAAPLPVHMTSEPQRQDSSCCWAGHKVVSWSTQCLPEPCFKVAFFATCCCCGMCCCTDKSFF